MLKQKLLTNFTKSLLLNKLVAQSARPPLTRKSSNQRQTVENKSTIKLPVFVKMMMLLTLCSKNLFFKVLPRLTMLKTIRILHLANMVNVNSMVRAFQLVSSADNLY